MIGRTNVGGGGATSSAWAYICVTYPSGSTCTATNGTITLSASNTSGSYVFQIPQPTSTPETWTVTCTNGSKTKSTTASITTQYQYVVVILRYSRLPEGYQEVEYLESDGTQYYDLGYYDNVLSHEYDLVYMSLSSSQTIFGSENTSATMVIIGRSNGNGDIDYYLANAIGDNGKAINQKISVVVNNASKQVVEDGTVVLTTTATSGDTKLVLFGTFGNSGQIYKADTRIYSFIQKDVTSGTIEKEFVPCYRTSDDEAGFYDLANNVFVEQDGTGSFIVGPDV